MPHPARTHLGLPWLLLGLLPGLWSAEPGDQLLGQLDQAMTTTDLAAKRAAIAALGGLKDDDVVLSALVRIIGDRQAGSFAIEGLRARTGLAPTRRSSGYPQYPITDDAAGWNQWLTARKAVMDREKALKDAVDKAKELEKKVSEVEKEQKAGKDPKDKEAATPDDGKGAKPPDQAAKAKEEKPASEKLDRIIFRNGALLRCHILSKRTDLDGRLTSVRIQHPDNGGEEVLAADLIVRIDEDID